MEEKRRVSFFISDLGLGGIEANTIRLANEFLSSGYYVDIVVVNLTKKDYKDRVSSGVNITNFNKKSVFHTLPSLIKYIKKRRPSCVISAGEGVNIISSISKLFVRKKTKIVLSIRTHLSSEYKYTDNSLKKLVFPFVSRIFYRAADHIVAVSYGVKNNVVEHLGIKGEKIEVIYNPIVDNSINHLKKEQNNHPWLKNKACPVILGAGRLTKQKDFETLIKAFYLVRKKIDSKLIIIGEGEERENLKKLVTSLDLDEHVDLVGFVSNPYSYMRLSDVFVLTSKWEGFGNVIVEALSTGTNVVSTNCPSGPSEILGNGSFGRLAPVEDIESISNSIISTIEAPKKKALLIERSKEFSVTQTKVKYEKLIFKI